MIVDTAADKLSMLLSTDWFQAYWQVIGLNTTSESRRCIQQGCREIVNQMIGDAEEYWLISIAQERVRATREALLGLGRRCGLDAASAERFEWLCRERKDREDRERTAWLFGTTRKELLSDPQLASEVKSVLEEAAPSFQYNDELKLADTQSQSAWDRRIRQLTPDLPTSLSDWISVGVLAEARLDYVLNCLSTEQQEVLRARFKVAAVKLTGLRESELYDCW